MKPKTRMHDLDAVRAFALLLGVVFHASLSFLPIPVGWAVMDLSTSPLIMVFALISHCFRMPLFFLLAGFFGRMTFHRNGWRQFLRSRALRLGIPFLLGWWILWPVIISTWIMGGARMRGEQLDVPGALMEGFAAFGQLPRGIYVQTHLWFLYYLLMITVGVLLLRGLVGLSGRVKGVLAGLADQFTTRLAAGMGILPVAVLTAAALWFMSGWGMDTPDRSLFPHVPVLAVYGGAFLLGWALHRNPMAFAAWARPGWRRLAAAAAAILCSLWLGEYQGDPSHPQLLWLRAGFSASYALMMWMLVFLTIGLFRRWLTRPVKWVRAVADASYWIYLAHLPVVVFLQVIVANWPLHWLVKWPGISLLSIGLCLLSYPGTHFRLIASR